MQIVGGGGGGEWGGGVQKSFFKSAENFINGNAGKLNMLTFQK